MYRAGYDPQAFVTFFEKIQNLEKRKPGAVANALLQVVAAGNYPPATCGLPNATYLQIYPPNQTTPIYLAFKTQACTSKTVHILTISVAMPGSGSAG